MKKITTLCATLMLTVFGLHVNAQINTFPYVEDFESGAGGWAIVGGGSWALGTPANTVINSASSGVNAWVTNLTGIYNTNENSQVESPIFDLSGTNNPEIHVKVWWECENSWDGAVLQSSINGGTSWQNVGAFGDPNNWYTDNSINGTPGGQQEGWTGNLTNGSGGWVSASHPITALNTQVSVIFRIAFGSDGSVQYEGFAFDDFSIFDITCPQPLASYWSNVTAYTADLFWSEPGTATAWEVEIDTAGFSPTGTATYPGLLDTNVTATGLLANTNYQYYVRAVCGTGDSSLWAGPYSFTTLCIPVASFYENFENVTAPAITNCWNVLYSGTNQFASVQTNNSAINANSGTNSVRFYNSSDLNPVWMLVSPELTNLSAGTHRTVFFAKDNDANDIIIGTMSDPNDAATFTAFDTITTSSSYQQYIVSFAAYSGSDTYVAYRSVPSGTYDYTYMDDIRIAEECTMPTAGTVSDLTSSSASLNWITSGTTATTWSIEYGPTGFVQGTGSVINTTFNPHPLAGLPDATTYDFYIISNCALGDKSPWAGPFNFTTFITGVDENTANNGVSIFPNPNNGIFSLEVNASDATVKVMNTQGQIILTKNILKNNAKIDLSNNAKGIYFITVTSENGVSTHKVSVQ